MNITGIVDAVASRRTVLEQRDRLASHRGHGGRHEGSATSTGANEQTEILREIRDALGRIETRPGRGDDPA